MEITEIGKFDEDLGVKIDRARAMADVLQIAAENKLTDLEPGSLETYAAMLFNLLQDIKRLYKQEISSKRAKQKAA
jgi:hypothetical protein